LQRVRGGGREKEDVGDGRLGREEEGGK
jgi:hypothetical protein